jgi:ACS family pantothenate transporter-like MFS transporter
MAILSVIDGIITLPVALYGFFLFPDTPRDTKAPYLTPEEKMLAISRVPEVPERTPMSWSFLKHCFTTWYWYFFVVLWILAGETESFSSNGKFKEFTSCTLSINFSFKRYYSFI